MITLVIDGLPTPWTPSRVTRSRHAFNPKYREKEYARWQIKAQWNQDVLSAAIVAHYTFHMPIPAGTSKIRKTQMLNNVIHHIKRPDADNLQKFTSDCLTGLVIQDDSQIWKVTSEKIYGLIPKTVIQLEVI